MTQHQRWPEDPRAPKQPLTVVIKIDGRKIAEGFLTRLRSDLYAIEKVNREAK